MQKLIPALTASLRQTCECSRTGSIQEVHKEMSLNGGSAKFKSRMWFIFAGCKTLASCCLYVQMQKSKLCLNSVYNAWINYMLSMINEYPVLSFLN